jgi:cytochrome c oxidase subunit 2
MKQLLIVALTFTVLMGLTITAHAAGDAAAGKKLFKMCAQCHGTDGGGNPITGAPLIAGQLDWYLKRQLMNFREGVRGAEHNRDGYGSSMRTISNFIESDQDVSDLAAYIATLDAPATASTIKADTTAGKATFFQCQACHGPTASGNEMMNAPKLAGQYDWYIVRQIKNFRAGVRGAHPNDAFGKQMATIAKTLPDETAINNVAAYIVTIK